MSFYYGLVSVLFYVIIQFFIHIMLVYIIKFCSLGMKTIGRMKQFPPESCSATAALSTDKMQCTLKAHIATAPEFP